MSSNVNRNAIYSSFRESSPDFDHRLLLPLLPSQLLIGLSILIRRLGHNLIRHGDAFTLIVSTCEVVAQKLLNRSSCQYRFPAS
jgi:hypothetical protein